MDLPEKAWVSRFWALYGRLPEAFKKGFIALARALARDAQEESRKAGPNGAGSVPPNLG
jgi:hypothetical protein